MPEPVVSRKDQGAAAWIWIQRPEVHNAFNADVIELLDEKITEASADPAVRAIVLASEGRSFSAGADLKWMREAAGSPGSDVKTADVQGLAGMLRRLETSPKATVARVQGTALGGGLGLISACDVSIAVARAKFGFSEVNLGLIPAVISPHVISKIGPGHARHLFVTGARFDAVHAERMGLISKVVDDEAALDDAIKHVLHQVGTSAPGAVARAKELIRQVTSLPTPEEVDAYTAEQIALCRSSDEGREGIAAFLEKRPPSWHPAESED
jgi:methylglutaconyl-CoA hydratase